MKGHKSVMSLSFVGQKFEEEKLKSKEKLNYDINSSWLQLNLQIEEIKKQLRQKVNRSQFISSLSTKLSISELASINFNGIKSKGKQNKSFNLDHNYLQLFDSLKRQIEAIDQKVTILFATQRSLPPQISDSLSFAELKQVLVEFQSLKEEQFQQKISLQTLQDQFSANTNSERQGMAEIQAYIYKKADRTQIQKLFTLNELLVIQIEQAKQKVDEYNRQIPKKMSEFQSEIKIYIDQMMQIQTRNMHTLQNQTKSQMKQLEIELDKMMDLLQQRQQRKQQVQQYYKATISTLNQKMNIIQEQQNLFLKELSARVNVLQLKQNQINRAVREVDLMKNQFQTIRLDVLQLYEKSNQVNTGMKQFCQITVAHWKNQMEQKINMESENLCSEIMKKIILLTEEMVNHEQFDQSINCIKQKNRQINLLQIQMEKKICYLDGKQKQIIENIQEEEEKNEQRLNLMRLQLNNYVNAKQLQEKFNKFITIQEIKQISKEIDQKISADISKIVEEQNKINEVVCSQNILAKWFWMQGTLKGGNLVAWDKQIINTLPENFKWNRNQPQIIISKSGYYRVQMGFYSKKKPTVQLIVNGQTIISAVNSNSYVIHHSSGKLRDVSNSEISGLTYIDFLLLPDNAKIAISYIGQFTGEGFFSIQRL